MHKNNLLALWVASLLAPCFANSQELATKLDGRIISYTNDVASVHIANLTTDKGTISNMEGFFSISATLGDTLVFSAVQFKKMEVIVTKEVMELSLFLVFVEDILNELDEVIVMPYTLSGDLNWDMANLKIGEITTSSTEDLPNANVRSLAQSERKLYTARTWDFTFNSIKLDPLVNFFSGRTKILNKRVAREAALKQIENVRSFYPDSLYINDLRISNVQIGDFIYFCEQDPLFKPLIVAGDPLRLWEFMRAKSVVYLSENGH